MYRHQEQVKEFHQKFNLVINDKPTIPDEQLLKLRTKLLFEEVLEFIQAAGYELIANFGEYKFVTVREPNLVEMADALTDIQYVNDGAAVSLGIDLEPLATEVHRSNLSKLWTVEDLRGLAPVVNKVAFGNNEDGYCVKDEFGKVIKSPSYSPAKINEELVRQGAEL